MALDENKERLFERLRYKYRLVVLNDDTFEEKLSFKLSRLNVFLSIGLSAILIIAGTTLLIALTPLREYIPGYSSTRLRKQALELVQRTDSLNAQLVYQHQYLENIQRIVEGRTEDSLAAPQALDPAKQPSEQELNPTEEEASLRKKVEEEERFNVNPKSEAQQDLENLGFFTPLKGVVSQSFNKDKGHLAVDVLAPNNSAIKACLDGYALLAEWTAETGHVLMVQHGNGLISVYKHNSALLKKQGDVVQAGEAIAIIGNSGELTTGPHLHFELWHEGKAVDPELFMRF
jgi:murein DD-endopeptidase MepM/ murein hydrolase activator NlpD